MKLKVSQPDTSVDKLVETGGEPLVPPVMKATLEVASQSLEQKQPEVPQLDNFLEEFIKGERTVGNVALDAESRQKAVDTFITLKNPYFQRMRYKELAVGVSIVIKKHIDKRITKEEFEALSQSLYDVIAFWADQWKTYPLNDAEYTLILQHHANGAWSTIVGTELQKVSTGESTLDAVTHHPLTSSAFNEFMMA